MIREGKVRDKRALIDLAIEALNQNPMEELLISREKLGKLADEFLGAKTHFCRVVEEDGELVGAMLSYTCPMTFYERSDTTIYMLFVKNGEGGKLIREFMRWFEGRRIIKQINFTGTGDRRLDKRIAGILKNRYGFRDDVPYLYKVR